MPWLQDGRTVRGGNPVRQSTTILHIWRICPSARHITVTAGPAPLSAEEIVHQLRGPHRVKWSFEIVRMPPMLR